MFNSGVSNVIVNEVGVDICSVLCVLLCNVVMVCFVVLMSVSFLWFFLKNVVFVLVSDRCCVVCCSRCVCSCVFSCVSVLLIILCDIFIVFVVVDRLLCFIICIKIVMLESWFIFVCLWK